jgi:hypothetical protein
LNTAALSIVERSYINQQNKIRGAIAALRSRAYRTDNFDALGEYRRSVLRIYSSVRAEIPVQLYDDFLDWINEIGKVVPEHYQQPIGFDFLHGFMPRTQAPTLLIDFLGFIFLI